MYENLKKFIETVPFSIMSFKYNDEFTKFITDVSETGKIYTIAYFDGLELTFDYLDYFGNGAELYFALGILDGDDFVFDGIFPVGNDLPESLAREALEAWNEAILRRRGSEIPAEQCVGGV